MKRELEILLSIHSTPLVFLTYFTPTLRLSDAVMYFIFSLLLLLAANLLFLLLLLCL